MYVSFFFGRFQECDFTFGFQQFGYIVLKDDFSNILNL